MHRVRRSIAEKQRDFARRAFFRRLEGPATVADARSFAQHLAFFVLVFQDVLRLNEARVRDPTVAVLLRHHRAEDRDHEQWFLRDLSRLGIRCDVTDLFGPAHQDIRDAAYAVMSEVFRTDSDGVRAALVLALEATGEVFFSRVPRYMDGIRQAEDLEYFSRGHAQVEENHSLLEAQVSERLDQHTWPEPELQEALAMVDRLFGAMTRMVDAFEAGILDDRRADQVGVGGGTR